MVKRLTQSASKCYGESVITMLEQLVRSRILGTQAQMLSKLVLRLCTVVMVIEFCEGDLFTRSLTRRPAQASHMTFNLGKMGNNRDYLLLCKSGGTGGQFRRRISTPTPWYQNPCDASIFLHARPNFRKCKNSIFRPNFDLSLGSSPSKIQGRIQTFFI